MKILVIKEFKYSNNGYSMDVYKASDEPIEVPQACGEAAIQMGCAGNPETVVKKAIAAAPKNKSLKVE